MRAVELHSVRKVRATKSRVRLGKKKKKARCITSIDVRWHEDGCRTSTKVVSREGS